MANRIEGPNDKWARIIGIPFLGLIIPIAFGHPGLVSLDKYLQVAFVSIFFTFSMWEGNRVIVFELRRRYPDFYETSSRVIFQVLFCTIYTIVAFTILYYFQLKVFGIGENSVNFYLLNLKISLIVTLIVISIYESAYFFGKWRQTIIEAERLKQESIRSQFESLKNQVNPHFLFNNLNTLITIIPEDADLAVEFVQKLSDVYRYILQNNEKEVVTLATELEVIRAYLFLVKIRFSDNFHVNIEVPEHYLNMHLPPLTLQMLIENVIKHNIISKEKPLTIDIYIEKEERLVVKNNLQKKNSRETSTKVGLQNIINRYTYLSENKVEVVVTSTNYIVTLPLISIQKL